MYKLLFSFSFCLFAFAGHSQQGFSAEGLSQRIAQKMKDSLLLSEAQKTLVYDINMQLHQQKMAVRSQHSGSEHLGSHLQKVENTRDSLYRAVMSPEQFTLYRQKKRSLISAN